MLDGRHTGTGGGNHVVLGGATPQDSPFLRRPDLLRSLISYWHNHPVAVVSVLGTVHRPHLAGAARRRGAQRFAVRARDRVRADSPRPATSVPPWLVDRLLRNLLIDVTGNTHRAEFCIDKLYSPDGPTGRLGLARNARLRNAAARAHELDPATAAALAGGALLAQALCARAPGALGHRTARPLHAAALRRAGFRRRHGGACRAQAIALQAEWFAPHFEFRFPKYGDFAARGMHLELRQALEPWHVMGEEGAPAVRCATSIRRSSGCR